MMKRLFFLAVLLFALPAAAQVTTASIAGRIVDEDGPIEGVTVVAIHQPSNTQYYATTDRHGWYQLLDVLPGGPYTVRIHYFNYKPLTVRNLYTFTGQNVVVDADLEAGKTVVRSDEAATSLRMGPGLEGGTVPVSPLGFDLVGQAIYTPVPFDVRQEATLSGVSRLRMTTTGTNRFHGSAYGYYGFPASSGSTGHLGLTLATPLSGDDYQLFAGLQYDGLTGFNGAGRFDARLGSTNRLDVSGGRLDGTDAWAAAGFTTQLRDGAASNRAQAGWYSTATSRQLLIADDFTVAAGSQRLLLGVQVAHTNQLLLDSAATRFDFYLQDAIRLGQRMTLLAGVRFSFPFAFSPRVSLNYDVMGNGALILRAGTAVYGVHGEGTVWKNLAAIDTRLPGQFYLTLEGIYGQSWKRPFYISSRNILDSRYALTARLERPLSHRFWAVASYTRSDGQVQDRILGGFSYRAEYLTRFATTAALFYTGCNWTDDLSPASVSLEHSLEARLTQDLGLSLGGRDHVLQLTAYARYTPGVSTSFLAGLKYIL